MKTVLEFSDRMPKGLRIRYLKNVVERNGVHCIFKKYRRFYDAINETMNWASTTEGQEFWETIAHSGIRKAYDKPHYKSYFKTP